MKALRWILAAAVTVAGGLALPGHAIAQARTLPSGTGAVTVIAQSVDNTGHRLSDGFDLREGQSVSRALGVEVAFGVTDRLSVSAGLPFVAARYTGKGPTPANLPVDSGRQWHSGFQDLSLHTRYNVLARGSLAVTPTLAVTLPSHAYNYQGEAVLGRRLRELQVGLQVARQIEEVSSRLDMDAGYEYAVVEKGPAGVGHNRSQASLGLGYAVTPRVSARVGLVWQRTHGGLRFGDGPGGALEFGGEALPVGSVRWNEHDRLLRDNFVHLEGGASYALGAFDLHAAYTAYVSGTDTHAGRAITLGASWVFQRAASPRAEP